MKPRAVKKAQGFTLIELLTVIAIIGILLSLAVPAYHNIILDLAPSQAAQQYASALRNLRDYSIANSRRTRLVFATEELVTAKPDLQLKPGLSYGMYEFYVPQQPDNSVTIRQLSERFVSLGARLELGQVVMLSIPSGFVGQWIPFGGRGNWREIPGNVRFVNPLEGATSYFAEFAATNFFVPTRYWDGLAETTNSFEDRSANSTFPSNYWRTPVPNSFPLISTNRAPEEPSEFGEDFPFSEIWPVGLQYRYFKTEPLDPPEVGFVNEVDSEPRWFELPGLEFQADGRPLFTTNTLSFRFEQIGNTNNAYEVFLDRATGIPRIR